MDCLRCPLCLLPDHDWSRQAQRRIQGVNTEIGQENRCMEQKAKTDQALGYETQHSQADQRGIVLMRGLRSFAYGLLAVLLPIALARSGETPAAIGVLITVSLLGDFVGTYVISVIADPFGRRRTLVLLALLMAATGIIFGLETVIRTPMAAGVSPERARAIGKR